MDDYVSFIDIDGNEISSEDISSHIGLARKIVDENLELKNEFEKSGKDAMNFLILDKGYIARGTIGNYYRNISYASDKISEKQKKIIVYYKEEGYGTTDFTQELKKVQEHDRD